MMSIQQKNVCILLGILGFSTGCNVSSNLEGKWSIELEDNNEDYEGVMDLEQEGSEISGTIELDFIDGCSKLEGEIEGEIDDGKGDDSLSFEIEFDQWTCDNNSYDIYDIEAEDGELIKEGVSVVEIEVEVEWGDDNLDMIAERDDD